MINKLKIVSSILFTFLLTSCYAQIAADSIADKILIYQLNNGGWPKQLEDKSVVNYSLPLTTELLSKIKATTPLHATFDNKATSREIVYLIKAYKSSKKEAYLKAAEKGIDYILSAQYANGGWPQYYPDKSSYRAQITYNDDAMINVLNILQDVATKANGFDAVNPSYVAKAEEAVKNGISCILKTQVKQNGNLSIWAAQYDKETLLPAKARNFEPASLSTAESVGIVRFLLRFPNPSSEVKKAISSAIKWFDTYKIKGYRFDRAANNASEKNAVLIADEASVVWARFYDLDKNIPIFGDRDNSIKLKLEELSPERRNGYAWYGNFAQKLLEKEYPKWLATNNTK